MEAAAPVLTQPRLDADGRLEQDLPCLRCGYNLRGLAPDRRCPECGTAIGRSVHGDMLRFCDPAWVSTLAWGMDFIWWGLAMLIILPLGFFPIVWTLITVPWRSVTPIWPGIIVSVAYAVLTAGLVFVGVWLLTTPDRGRLQSEPDPATRKVTRVLVVVAVVVLLVDRLMRVTGWAVVLLSDDLAGLVLLTASLAPALSVLPYAARLGERGPDPRLAGSAKGLGKSASICVVVLLCAAVAGLVLELAWASTGSSFDELLCGLRVAGAVLFFFFSLWAMRLVHRYARLLRSASKEARQSWAAER